MPKPKFSGNSGGNKGGFKPKSESKNKYGNGGPSKPRTQFKKNVGEGRPSFQKKTGNRDFVKKDFGQKRDDFNKKRKYDGDQSKGYKKGSDSFQTEKRFLTKKEKRKAAKPENFGELYKEKIKSLPKEQQVKLMGEELKAIKGKIAHVVFEEIFKKEAMKTVQLILKYGSDEHRQTVYDELKGQINKLANHVNGYYLVKNLIRYVKNKHSDIINELSGHFKELLFHKDASIILNYLWEEATNGTEKSHILLEFYSQEYVLFKPTEKLTLDDILAKQPQKKEVIMKNLKDTVTHLSDKGPPLISSSIVHHLFFQYISHADRAAIVEFVTLLREQIPYLVHTFDGARVAAAAVSFGSVKDRKVIIKGMQGYITKTAMEEYGHIVILRILDLIDDTVLINKSVLSPLLKEWDEVITNDFGLLIFMYLLSPRDPKYFKPTTMQVMLSDYNADATKKTMETRRQEMLDHVIDKLVSHCSKHADVLLKDKAGCDLFFEVTKASNDENKEKLIEEIIDLTKEAQDNIMSRQWSHRLLKKMVVEIDGFAEKFAKSLKQKHIWATQKQPGFVVLSLLEHESTKDQVASELRSHLKSLKECTEPACKLIVDNLNGVKSAKKQ